MEFRPLRAFVEVVRQGGFSRAAETLHLTQSTVSKAVQQLEQELGTILLERIGHRTLLTPAGKILFDRGVKLLADREDVLVAMRELRGLKRGTLRLGLPPIGSDMLFAPLFADYRRRYPDITVQLVEHGSDQLEQLLRDGSIDLAGLLLPASSDFDFRWVQKEPLVVILPFDHPLANQTSVTMLDLQREAFILFENSFSLHRIILEACRKEKFEPAVVATSSQIDFVIELVSSGLGIAFLPQTIARQRAHAKVKAVLLSQADAEWQMVMAWRRNGYLSEAATAWLRLLEDDSE